MKSLLGGLLTIAFLLAVQVPARADITGASVTPAQRQLTAGTANSLALSWRVTTTAIHRAGATSSSASVVDPDTGTILGSTGMPLSAAGAGPITFNETIVVSSALIGSWQAQGLSRVLLRRVFDDPGSSATASATVSLLLPVNGALTSARVSPTQRQVFASQDNRFSLNWQVSAISGYSAGISSSSARVQDPRTGTVIAQLGGRLVASGSGPYALAETVELAPTLVDGWLSQGLNRVLLTRTFTDPTGGSSVDSSLVLLLSNSRLTAGRDAVSGELTIQGLQLAFRTGNNLTLVDQDSELKARLTVIHSGSGLLEGRWLVAEPGSSEGQPLFRTLALVRKNLSAGQRNYLASPVLPTARAGKYLLRFCATSGQPAPEITTAASVQCPLQNLVVEAAYQVQGESASAIAAISGLSPNQQAVSSTTPFRWPSVSGARVYQLQVFTLAPVPALPSLDAEVDSLKPEFVVGMVLPAGTSETPLSDLVRSRLQVGQRYLWRITAHDESGRLIASSTEYSFVFLGKTGEHD